MEKFKMWVMRGEISFLLERIKWAKSQTSKSIALRRKFCVDCKSINHDLRDYKFDSDRINYPNQ